MERGPLPPHERTWRHPSELAAEERAAARSEAAAPSTRTFALTTGTIGLLAVGILIFTVSPRRQESPIAISATTTPAASEPGGPGDTAAQVRSLAPTALSSTVSTRPARLAEQRDADALATPIGDGRFALVTDRAVADHGSGRLDVRFASGRVVEAEVIASDAAGVAIVALEHAEPGHAIASRSPAAHDMVTVMVSPPVRVAYRDVDTLAVHEGTAVLDGDGAIVAICTRAREGVDVLEITAEIAGATTAGR